MVLIKEIEDLYENFKDAVYGPGKLDLKTKELIAFSNSVMIDCKHCMRFHYQSAIEAGATPEEIAESVGIAMTVSSGKIRGITRDIIMELNENG